MSPPHLFSLSNELLIDIISDLRPLDIHACQCACRRLNNVIVNSQLIQYILHTALSGVFDPLEPGISLPDRLDALERWETAWREMDLGKPIAVISPPPGPGHGNLSVQLVDYIEQHVIAPRSTSLGLDPSEPAGYSFLDLSTWLSSPTNVTRWTTIDVQIPNVLAFIYAPELNLTVALSATDAGELGDKTVVISPLWFNTGEPHPLASRSKLEVTISHPAIYNLSDATIIGDYILYWVGVPISEIHEKTTLCNIYLVAWKGGWISKLHASLPDVYGAGISVISEEIILLIRLREPALELCRLANIGDRRMASLETVCILSLPVLTSTAYLQWAYCAEEPPSHALFSPHSYPHVTRVGTRCRRLLRSVPSDGIVSVVMQANTLLGDDCIFDFIIQCRTLLEFTDPQSRVGAAGVGMDARTVLILPWDSWGPTNARMDKGSFPWGGLSGERRAMVLARRITMRDYNPYRVQRALALLGVAGREVTLACGSVVKVVKEATVYRGSGYFCNDIETSLPYVETVTKYKGCYEVSMDENFLVVEVRTKNVERKLHLHSL